MSFFRRKTKRYVPAVGDRVVFLAPRTFTARSNVYEVTDLDREGISYTYVDNGVMRYSFYSTHDRVQEMGIMKIGCAE